MYADLTWTSFELKELVNKRLSLITNNSLDIKNAFDKVYKNGTSGFEYMLERTFYRPRDVISFINHAIENASNKGYLSLDILKRAETDYSIERLQAIEDEWGENYGDISRLSKFLYSKHNGFRLKNVKEDDFDTTLLEENPTTVFKGELASVVMKWQNNSINL